MAHYVFVSQKADSGYALTLQKGREEVAFVNRVYEAWLAVRQHWLKLVCLVAASLIPPDDVYFTEEGWGKIRDSIAKEIQNRVSLSGHWRRNRFGSRAVPSM